MQPELFELCSPNQALYPVLSLDQLSSQRGLEADSFFPTDPSPGPESYADFVAFQEQVEDFLSKCSPTDRKIFEECLIDERPQKEVAAALGINASAVSKRVARLRKQLLKSHPIFTG